jgi:RecB family exonuclease
MSIEQQSGSPADHVSTVVDGVEVLGALSPSRAGDFMACPLLYRFRTIDRLPEPSSPDAVRGSLVHKVLEDLYDLPATARTPEQARAMLVPTWESLLAEEPDIAEMFAPAGEEGTDVDSWLVTCREVLDRYFTLEDPRQLEPAERELYVETLLDSRLLLRGFVDRLDIAPDGRIRVVDYKGLAVDTPLPTPEGWTTMGEVEVGDRLVGADGRPTRVTRKSGVHHRPCYRVTFRDGSSVVCDNVHLWRVVTSRRQNQTVTTVDTDALFSLHEDLRAEGRVSSLWVEAAQAIDLPDDPELLVDPWILGAWLGDGDSRAGHLTVGKQDSADMLALLKEHWPRQLNVTKERTVVRVALSKFDDRCTYGHAEFRPATPGHATRRCTKEHLHGSQGRWNVCLTAALRKLGVLSNKHIPSRYLRAGTSQRMALLRGLMDTDGWWNKQRRRAGFTTTDDRIAEGVVELLRTLGVNPCHFKKPYVNAVRPSRTWHVIEFTPTGFNPFSLPRKAMACEGAVTAVQSSLARRRIVAQVERVPTVPTQCVAVDAPDSLYLCGTGFVPTHNTGRSPHERFEAKALFQMKFYALVIWRTRGVIPSMLQLVYLGNSEIMRYVPDEQDLLATERKVEAIWHAIRRAEETGDWRPNPSRLCDWCAHQALCPAFGGTPPPLPAPVVDTDPGALTAEDVDAPTATDPPRLPRA